MSCVCAGRFVCGQQRCGAAQRYDEQSPQTGSTLALFALNSLSNAVAQLQTADASYARSATGALSACVMCNRPCRMQRCFATAKKQLFRTQHKERYGHPTQDGQMKLS